MTIYFFFLLSSLPLFCKGCVESNPRFSRPTLRSSITSIILLGLKSHASTSKILDVILVHLVLVRQTGPFVLACKACLRSLSWGILLTWPNHLNWDLSIQRSNGSTLKDFQISKLRTLSNSATPSILYKNLVSAACTCDSFFSSLPKTHDC